MNLFNILVVVFLLTVSSLARSDDFAAAKYLGNAGVLISHGETRIVFDPLFDIDFDTYERVPADIEKQLFDGVAPFDGLDAIFVSHHHGDHFSPDRMVQLLKALPEVELFAPQQAINAMPIEEADNALRERLHAVVLGLDDEYHTAIGNIEVSAVRVPHSGWPTRHNTVENIAFRVSLDGQATVLHMGDAHTDPAFYDSQASYWAARKPHLAMPPYWFFLSDGGEHILDEHIRADLTFGVHVPEDMPDSPSQYPEELRGRILLSIPGEEKRIPLDRDAN